MTQYFLANDVSLSQGGQTVRLPAGKLVDDANQNVTTIVSAGGVLVANTVTSAQQAALLVKYKRYKGQGQLLDVARELGIGSGGAASSGDGYVNGLSSGQPFETDWAVVTPGSTLTLWKLPTPIAVGEQVDVRVWVDVQASFTPQAITAATNGAPIVCTIADTSKLATNSLAQVSGGAGNTAMNGSRAVTVLSPTTFSLTGSDGTLSGSYVAGSAFVQAGDFGQFTRQIAVRNLLGTILTAQGTTADFDLTQPIPNNNMGASLVGCLVQIVIASGTLVVNVTAPAGISVRTKISQGAWFRGALTTAGPQPTVGTPSISSGSTLGGADAGFPYTVIIPGTGFTSAAFSGSVTFNGVPASFVVNSDTQITATPGAGSAGSGVIAVSTLGGTGFSAANAWTYNAPPTLALTIQYGKYEGGDTIVGSASVSLLTGYSFKVAGVPVTGLVIGGGGTTFSFTLPASAGATSGGLVNLTATNAALRTTVTMVNGLYYLPSGITEIFDAARGTTPSSPTDGQNLSAWAGVGGVATGSGGGWSTSQGTTANQPVYVASSACGGKPAVKTTLAGGPGAVPQVWPLANGVIPTPQAQTQFTYLMIGTEQIASNNGGYYFSMRPAGGGDPSFVAYDGFTFGGGKLSSRVNATSGATSTVAAAGAMQPNTPEVISIRHDATTAKVRLNGLDGVTPFADTTTYTFTNFQIACGAPTIGEFHTCLVLAWNRALVTADFTSLSTFVPQYGGSVA